MDLQAFSITSLPLTLKLDDALEIAHGPSLDTIESSLDRRANVLVTCPREVAAVVLQALRARGRRTLRKDAGKLVPINGLTTGDSSRSDPVVRMLEQIRESLRAGADGRVLVLTDLDALVGEGDNFDRGARAAIPMLFEDPGAVFLAFHDPMHSLSTAAAPLFRTRVTFEGIALESLTRLVTQREARSMHATELDAVALHRFVAGMNAVTFRRAMEDLGRQHEASAGQSRRAECYSTLRALTSDGLSVPPESFERDVAGYSSVTQTLRDEVVGMHLRRWSPMASDDARALAEAAPRTVRLQGPDGTGKALLARCIAHSLSSVVVVLDALAMPPDDREMTRYVRDTVARARKSAPSVLVVDHHDVFTPLEDKRLMSEVAKIGRDEAVVVVILHHHDTPTTDRNIEVSVTVPRPSFEDHRALVAHHARKLGLPEVPEIHEGSTAQHIVTALRAHKRRLLRDDV